MPKLDKEIKEKIKKLRCKDLQNIVIALISKEKYVYDYVLLNFLDKENGEQDLFKSTKSEIEIITKKKQRGVSVQLQQANMLIECIKHVNKFAAVSKNKVLEAKLLLFILEFQFKQTSEMFGTCFTKYDTRVAMILKRLIIVITKNLHEDYKIEFENKVNEYLKFLHRTSNHIDSVYNLPKEI